jgi:acyl-ACP thioesterase
MQALTFTELVQPPAAGRVFEQALRPGLADVDPTGRVRLDGLARRLQDVAWADIDDAGVADMSVWVVRRMRIKVAGFPRFGQHLRARTFCSGVGRMWAERRTTIEGEGAAVESVGLWVHLDPQTWRPAPFPEPVERLFSEAARSRVVKARLRHPPPAAGAERGHWRFNVTDLDLASHVNNAAYWEPLEEILAAGPELESFDGEIEFREPAQPGEIVVLRDTGRMWITAPDGLVHASVEFQASPG